VSDFQSVVGFEEVWRPIAVYRRRPQTVLSPGPTADVRARLARISSNAPEVMVKVTGRTHSAAQLRAHLQYISQRGGLEMEDRDGQRLVGRGDVDELAADWSVLALMDRQRRSDSPFTHSIVLSMPAGTDAAVVRDAARAFAGEVFGERFDHVSVLHTDTPHPHVHLVVCAQGDNGERLNPSLADLELRRQIFARALRDRGVAAEATPRRARGVTRKAEPIALRKMRDQYESGLGPISRTLRSAYGEAAKAAFGGTLRATPWERRLLEQQVTIRALYKAQADALQASPDPADQALGRQLATWVEQMPAPESRRLALARELRMINQGLARPERDDGRGDRTRMRLDMAARNDERPARNSAPQRPLFR
jgi:hypothetical protein